MTPNLTSPSSTVETHLLSKRFRHTVALDGVTLTVPPGAIYALVGANGAGKTTLIKLLMNIFAPSSGSRSRLSSRSR